MALFIEKQLLPNEMKEIVDVIVKTGTGFKRGSLHESGTLNLDKGYPAWDGRIAERIQGKDGRLVSVDDVLVRGEDFDEIAKELDANGIEIGFRYKPHKI